MNSLLPLETLAATVKALLLSAEKLAGQANDKYMAVGIHLIEARDRIAKGEDTKYKTFMAFWVGGCHISKSRVYELIAVAEGSKTIEEVRARANTTSKAAHAKTRAAARSSPLNSGRSSEIDQEDQECDISQKLVGNLLDDFDALSEQQQQVFLQALQRRGRIQIVENLDCTEKYTGKLNAAEPQHGAATVKEYKHIFEHGTCHLLPHTTDYEDSSWVQWRAANPGGWWWRYREVDEQSYLVRDSRGRLKRPGPWFNPDGTKYRPIDGSSPKGREMWAEMMAAERAA
jgi:hypothetical protein